MKKRLYISVLLTALGFCNSAYAIKGTFYNSISNNTATDLWSGMEYEKTTDRWDNCGWWSGSNWGFYRTGNDCSTKSSDYKNLNSGSIIGQTGGHESNRGTTSAHQTFFLDAPKGTRKFVMWNDVNGSGDEHLYIKMWCNNVEKLSFETRSNYGGNPALFIKTIFNKSTTQNKVDLGYIIMDYSPEESRKPDMEIDLFNLGNGLSNISSIGYVKECF